MTRALASTINEASIKNASDRFERDEDGDESYCPNRALHRKRLGRGLMLRDTSGEELGSSKKLQAEATSYSNGPLRDRVGEVPFRDSSLIDDDDRRIVELLFARKESCVPAVAKDNSMPLFDICPKRGGAVEGRIYAVRDLVVVCDHERAAKTVPDRKDSTKGAGRRLSMVRSMKRWRIEEELEYG